MADTLSRNIVCAVNGSEASLKAFKYALILTKEFNLNLHVVYVVDTMAVNFLQQSPLFGKEEKLSFEKDLWNDGHACIENVQKIAKEKNIRIHTEILDGEVVSCIRSYAEKNSADMILIGGKDENGKIVSKSVIRSPVNSNVRDEMLKSSRCPVLIVQLPKIDTLFKIL